MDYVRSVTSYYWTNQNVNDTLHTSKVTSCVELEEGLQLPRLRAWIPNEAVSACQRCLRPFDTIHRKHHCRLCGRIFCAECCSGTVSTWQVQHRRLPQPPTSYLGSMFSLRLGTKDHNIERVCIRCVRHIPVESLYRIFLRFELTLLELRPLSMVCRVWHAAVVMLRVRFREIGELLSGARFPRSLIRLLELNSSLLAGHARCRCSCSHLMCLRPCQAFGVSEALELLYKAPKLAKERNESSDEISPTCPLPSPIRKLCVDRLNSISDQELPMFIPALVHLIRYEKIDDLCKEHALSGFLLKRCLSQLPLRHQLYWYITLHCNEGSAYISRYHSFSRILLSQISPIEMQQLDKGVAFIEVTSSAASKGPLTLESNLKSLFAREHSSLELPINPSVPCNGIDWSGIRIKKSASSPVMIPITYNGKISTTVLYKPEDLRKDAVILCVIRLCDALLRNDGLNYNIVTYNVLPVSPESGFVEFVPRSETLHSIRNQSILLNWILSRNTDHLVKDINHRFRGSAAAFCVITYLLGIGDRHLENIMVTEAGELFHIDFGFILGSDPKPLPPHIRITAEMITAMGGQQEFLGFCRMCARIFLSLRRHVHLITNILRLLCDYSPALDDGVLSLELLINEVEKRFMPGLPDNEAEVAFLSRITDSAQAYAPVVNDFFRQVVHSGIVDSVKDGISSLASYLPGSS